MRGKLGKQKRGRPEDDPGLHYEMASLACFLVLTCPGLFGTFYSDEASDDRRESGSLSPTVSDASSFLLSRLKTTEYWKKKGTLIAPDQSPFSGRSGETCLHFRLAWRRRKLKYRPVFALVDERHAGAFDLDSSPSLAQKKSRGVRPCFLSCERPRKRTPMHRKTA